MSILFELIKMAFRNVGRNRRRSIISGTTIAVGVTAIVFASSYIKGLNGVIESEVTDTRFGSLSVQRAGYGASQDLAPLELDLPEGPAIDEPLRAVGNVSATVPRIKFVGIISNGETSTMFVGNAFDTAREPLVCPRGPGGKGGWFSGVGFSGPDAAEVVLGTKLAHGLGVKVGDSVTLLVQTKPGAQDAMDLTVVGTFDSRDVIEGKHLVAMPLVTAQRLLHMPGRVTGYTVRLREPQDLDDTVADVRRALAKVDPAVEVQTWKEMAPFYHDVINLFDTTLGVVVSVVFILALAGIVNTMLMAVFERTREVGTLMSLGFKRRRIVVLFLAESAILGGAAAIVGGALGTAIVFYAHARGLEFHLPSIGLLLIRPVWSTGFLLTVVGATAAGALVGGLYPAYRASRLRPVEALHST